MENDPAFATFVERRARVLDRLDSSRVEVDGWIEAHKTQAASVVELAQLEGLLAERRKLLEDLMRLDDSLLEHLVVLLGRSDGKAKA